MRAIYLVLLLLAGASQAFCEEEVQKFRSEIVIQHDGSLLITETIDLRSEARLVQHGFCRGLPWGEVTPQYPVSYSVVSVTMDGQNSPYEMRQVEDEKKLCVGDKNILLAPGLHSYVLQYRALGRIKQGTPNDSLRWSVTGNFPITVKKPSAVVYLPHLVTKASVKATGETERLTFEEGEEIPENAIVTTDVHTTLSEPEPDQTVVMVALGRDLRSGETFRLSLEWPKGFIKTGSALVTATEQGEGETGKIVIAPNINDASSQPSSTAHTIIVPSEDAQDRSEGERVIVPDPNKESTPAGHTVIVPNVDE